MGFMEKLAKYCILKKVRDRHNDSDTEDWLFYKIITLRKKGSGE